MKLLDLIINCFHPTKYDTDAVVFERPCVVEDDQIHSSRITLQVADDKITENSCTLIHDSPQHKYDVDKLIAFTIDASGMTELVEPCTPKPDPLPTVAPPKKEILAFRKPKNPPKYTLQDHYLLSLSTLFINHADTADSLVNAWLQVASRRIVRGIHVCHLVDYFEEAIIQQFL